MKATLPVNYIQQILKIFCLLLLAGSIYTYYTPAVASSRQLSFGDTTAALAPLQLADSFAVVKKLMRQYSNMPGGMKFAIKQFVTELGQQYGQLSAHQKSLLDQELPFTGRVISKTRNTEEYLMLAQKFSAHLEYIREQKGYNTGYCVLVNAASEARGGQKMYLVDLQTGEMVETPCSTAWRGVGFVVDSYTTPLGFFRIKGGRGSHYQSLTMLGQPSQIFRKLEKQKWLDMTKWLRRVSTRLEKAYILSNQFALKGGNHGDEAVPLTALKDYSNLDSARAWIDNSNSADRHIYIHGTNRLDQLGYSLSGGCVRVSNVFSYLLANIYKVQEEIPVFIDYVKLKEGEDTLPENLEEVLADMENYDMVAQPHKSLLHEDFTDNQSFRRNIYYHIVKKVARELASNPQVKVKIIISSSLPLPEPALRDWLKYRDSLQIIGQKSYRHHYDLYGRHFSTTFKHDTALHKVFTPERVAMLHRTRADIATKYIVEALKEEVKLYEMPFEMVQDRLMFEAEVLMLTGKGATGQGIGYNLGYERRKVLEYMEMLDSLATSDPRTFREHNAFGWIANYLDKPVHEFNRQGGSKKYTDIVTYNDAILAQAYLLAIGEMQMRHKAMEQREIAHQHAPEFYDLYQINTPGFLNEADREGALALCQHSRSPASKLSSRFLIGNLKQNNQRILGIIHVAEEFYSQYKKYTNKLVVKYIPVTDHKQLLTSASR